MTNRHKVLTLASYSIPVSHLFVSQHADLIKREETLKLFITLLLATQIMLLRSINKAKRPTTILKGASETNPRSGGTIVFMNNSISWLPWMSA